MYATQADIYECMNLGEKHYMHQLVFFTGTIFQKRNRRLEELRYEFRG